MRFFLNLIWCLLVTTLELDVWGEEVETEPEVESSQLIDTVSAWPVISFFFYLPLPIYRKEKNSFPKNETDRTREVLEMRRDSQRRREGERKNRGRLCVWFDLWTELELNSWVLEWNRNEKRSRRWQKAKHWRQDFEAKGSNWTLLAPIEEDLVLPSASSSFFLPHPLIPSLSLPIMPFTAAASDEKAIATIRE